MSMIINVAYDVIKNLKHFLTAKRLGALYQMNAAHYSLLDNGSSAQEKRSRSSSSYGSNNLPSKKDIILRQYSKVVENIVKEIEKVQAEHKPQETSQNNTRSSISQDHCKDKIECLACSPYFGEVTSLVPSTKELNLRYRKLFKIGAGAYGKVYIVYDTKTSCYLTMKVINNVIRESKNGCKICPLFHREIYSLSVLSHPNIVPVVDYHFLKEGPLVLFFPIVRHDFSRLMRHWNFNSSHRRHIPLPIVKCLFRQILQGVNFMNNKQIVHRDLKPSNLMVDENGVVKIIDFGWSRALLTEDDMTKSTSVIRYRSPEMVVKYSRIHQYYKMDHWACGCILFELLTGRVLVPAETELEAMECLTDLLGTPPEIEQFTGLHMDVFHRSIKNFFKKPNRLLQVCERLSVRKEDAEYLELFLRWDPQQRMSLNALAQHEWFASSPPACFPKDIPLPDTNWWDWVMLREKRQRRT